MMKDIGSRINNMESNFMKKRILIFSPYTYALEGIESMIRNYFITKLPEVYRNTKIEKFRNIRESIDLGCKIGLLPEQDILVVLDRKMCPEDRREKPMNRLPCDRIYFQGLQMLVDMSKKICDELSIPYIMYTGEVEKRNKPQFMGKLDDSLNKIIDKYNEKFNY